MSDIPSIDDLALPQDEQIEVIRRKKQSDFNYRKRRQPDWNEIYFLYRDKVIYNRLTQRQSVNIPLMKYTVKTLLKDIDEPPLLYFDSLDNDDQKEVFYNEAWKEQSKWNKLTIKDIVDKKQVLLFGRSFKKLNMCDGHFYFEIVAPEDMLVDRYVDPSNIDTARELIHEHIYKPLKVLKTNDMYDQKALSKLEDFYGTNEGLVKQEQNLQDMFYKADRMQKMGVSDAYAPILGETYIELNEVYMFKYDEKKAKEVIYLVVTADGVITLLDKPLYEVIGETSDHFWDDHYPYTTWTDDPERTDFWSDGVGDILRTPNKIVNSFFAQMVENRTMRNFGMNYYNSSKEGFVPQTFTPVPWGWYPIPVPENGKISDVVQNVPIQALEDNLEELNFILQISDKASAATTAQQGAVEDRQVTLGEVQLALQNAKDRVKAMAVFYNQSWEEFGIKYMKMIEAAPDLLDDMTISKKGRHGLRTWTTTITPSDLQSKSGWRVEVKLQADKDEEDIEQIQKLNAARSVMMGNPVLDQIYKKKILEFSGLSLSETNEVLNADKEMLQQQQQMNQMMQQNGGQNGMMNQAAPGGTQQPLALPAPASAPQPQVTGQMPAMAG